MDVHALKLASRAIREWTGAIGQSAYFARECHDTFAELGLGQPVGEWREVVVSTPTTFHGSRAAALGDVPAEVAAAVFPQMAPRVVTAAVERVRAVATPGAIVEARRRGAVASLERILGPDPAGIDGVAAIVRRACDGVPLGGRPFAAALIAQGWTGEPLADACHGAEVLRELRGDAHNASWLGRGFTGPQIHIATELWYGLVGCGYRNVWGWTRAELARAEAQLIEDGLIGAEGLTELGRRVRDEIEDATDDQMLHVMRNIADDVDDLARFALPLSRALVTGKGALMVRPSYFTWLSSQPAYRCG